MSLIEADDLDDVRSSPEWEEVKRHYCDREWRLDNLYFIQDENGDEIRFRRNEAQRAYSENSWSRDLICKARQLGFSTFIGILITDTCVFRSGTSAGIVDETLRKAREKLAKIKYAYDRLPADIRQELPLVRQNTEELQWANGSKVTAGTSYRGGTLQMLHVCLAGDTGIYTAGGVVKPISEIVSGDRVLTSGASYRPVKALIKNRLSDLGVGFLEVSTFGYPDPLKITENHRVMVREHKTGRAIWRSAKELQRGDYVAFPIREPSKNLRDGLLPFGDGRIEPSPDLGWLCGFYLAEGSTRKRAGNAPTDVQFSIDLSEVALTITAVEKLCLKDPIRKGAKRINIGVVPDSRTRTVTVNSRSLAGFLYHHFGCGDDKRIPDKVWKWGAPFLHAMVKGYIDGDGSDNDPRIISAVSTRRQLIDQLRLLFISLRFGVPAIYRSEAGVRYGRSCKESWTLKLGGAGNWKFRERHNLALPPIGTKAGKWRLANGRRPEGRKLWRRGANVYWSRVLGVKEIEPVEFVYDIVLDVEPHDYVTVNGVVHNSELGKISVDSPEIAKEIKTGALRAVHANGFVAVESTAHGTGGEFYEMVQRADSKLKEGAPLTALDFKLHFYGWWIKREYRLPNNLVTVSQDLQNYFTDLEAKHGLKLDADQRAWYAKQFDELGPDDTKQEFPSVAEETFYNSLQGSYFKREMSKARQEGRIGDLVPFDPTRRVNTFWDIGEDCTAIVFHQTDGLRHRIVDYWEEEGSSLQEACAFVEQKRRDRGFVYDTHYGPHDIDNRDWGNNAQARKKTAEGLGIKFEVVPQVSDKADSIEAARRFIGLAWFDAERCSRLVECLDNYRKTWNKQLGAFTSKPVHDWASHGNDALQQGAMGLKPDRPETMRHRPRETPRTTQWAS